MNVRVEEATKFVVVTFLVVFLANTRMNVTPMKGGEFVGVNVEPQLNLLLLVVFLMNPKTIVRDLAGTRDADVKVRFINTAGMFGYSPGVGK